MIQGKIPTIELFDEVTPDSETGDRHDLGVKMIQNMSGKLYPGVFELYPEGRGIWISNDGMESFLLNIQKEFSVRDFIKIVRVLSQVTSE